MLCWFSTGLWECFGALTSMSLHYFHRSPRFVVSSVQQGEEREKERSQKCTIIGALHTHIGLPGLFTLTHTHTHSVRRDEAHSKSKD